MSEIVLVGMKVNIMIGEFELLLKRVVVFRCYCVEVGVRGVDMKGLYWVYEFIKVELFVWMYLD